MTQLADGQYEFTNPQGQSLLMGRDTPIRVISVEGLLSQPEMDSFDQARSGQHGMANMGPRHYRGRKVTFELVLEEEVDDVEVLLDNLHTAFQTVQEMGTLTFKRRAKAQRYLECSVRRSEFSANWGSWVGMIRGGIELFAPDPRVYSTASQVRLDAVDPGVGRFYDRVYPMEYGENVNSSVAVTNLGNIESYPSIRIYGPVTNPILTNSTSGQAVKCLLTLGENDYLDLDFDYHTIVLNGSTSRRASLAVNSAWWALEPGENLIHFQGSDLVGAYAVLEARSAWISG